MKPLPGLELDTSSFDTMLGEMKLKSIPGDKRPSMYMKEVEMVGMVVEEEAQWR